jgi:hypothetical protein
MLEPDGHPIQTSVPGFHSDLSLAVGSDSALYSGNGSARVAAATEEMVSSVPDRWRGCHGTTALFIVAALKDQITMDQVAPGCRLPPVRVLAH